jgi:hypothetical protein
MTLVLLPAVCVVLHGPEKVYVGCDVYFIISVLRWRQIFVQITR